jgi:L-aminopeptidase/D-esterase-like protein
VNSFPITGVRVGHSGRVTVLLLPAESIGSGEVRGGAPASRELDLLEPSRTVARVDAIVFAGGSAFGLAAADGVMRYLAERGQGYATASGPVPIVPAACIFDLVDADDAAPSADDGYDAAVVAARDDALAVGRIGAGSAATVGKWRGRDGALPGGLGVASARVDTAEIAALAVVNAVGDVLADDGSLVAGSTSEGEPFPESPFAERENTTLVALVTDARLTKLECFLLAQSAHDGFARAIRPAHTRYDGDLAIVAATGRTEANLDRLRIAAADVVADAIRSACR